MPVEFNHFPEIGAQAEAKAQVVLDKASADGAAMAAVKAPKWLGSLAGSIVPGPGLTPDSRRINVASEYGAPVEYGARAHWLPKAAIEGELAAWAAAHGMAGAEYAIAHKISEEGTPAQPFLTPAMEELAAVAPAWLRSIITWGEG